MHGTSQNARPIAAMAASPTVTGKTVSFKDNSTDAQDSQSVLFITVNWGDWSQSQGVGGGTFTHTYEFSGTYTINHTAKDKGGLTGFENVSVFVP
jgi:PKD repeat protein